VIIKQYLCERLLIRIKHKQSVGQSTAILTGVRAATGELIVTMDADGQNDPNDIPVMLQQALLQPEDTTTAAKTLVQHN